MITRPDDPDAPYLPERYRLQVKVKKQRRMYKKLGAAGVLIVVIIGALLLFTGMLAFPPPVTSPQSPVTPMPTKGEQPPAPVVNVTAAVTPVYGTGTGISTLHSADMLSLVNAVSALREEYPEDTYLLISLNLTDRYAGHMLYEYRIQPVTRDSTGIPFTILNNAATGEPYTQGQESARITVRQAQDLAKKAFPAIQPDHVRVRYSDRTEFGRSWNFTLVKGSSPLLTGSMDAETGVISSFSHTIRKIGRPAAPVLTLPAAQEIAERYISDQNGPVAVNMSEARYVPLGFPSDPVAGRYIFSYSRIVNNIPCEDDGFIIGIDSVNGAITAYERHWSAPDNAFAVASEPIVLKRDATFSVLKKAKETFPASVNGLRIVSAELRWKDKRSSLLTPRIGSIPLAWKVIFDDDIIRSNSSLQPALAWVDVLNGNILDFEYRH